MATKAVLQNPAPTEIFLKLPHTILSATRFVSLATEERLPLSANDKIIFLYMKGRHDYFTGQGNQYFDSQQAIASACGLSVATVKRTIKALRDHGYLTVKASMGSNRYTFVADLKVSTVEAAPALPQAANDAYVMKEEGEPDFRVIEYRGGYSERMDDGPPDWCTETLPDCA
ncbi:helix-turn-helix domain-containing protein [Pseudomonas sp. D1-3]